jgi:hypothetical protein
VGQEQQAHFGMRGPQPLSSNQATIRFRWHTDVQNRDICGLGRQQGDHLVTIGRTADDLMARRAQQHE